MAAKTKSEKDKPRKTKAQSLRDKLEKRLEQATGDVLRMPKLK